MRFLLSTICIVYGLISCNGQIQKFPTPPTIYSGVVSQQIADRGFTLGYTEYYDGTQNVLRTEGRYGSWDAVDIIDFSAPSWIRYTPTSCQKLKNFTVTNSLFTRQSMRFFDDRAEDIKTLLPGKQLARNVWCDVWRTVADPSTVMNPNDTALITDYYFDTNTKMPMRITQYGYTRDMGEYRLVDRTYDWVNLTVETTQSLGNLRYMPGDVCVLPLTEVASFAMSQLPTNTPTAPPTDPILPTVPTQFVATWESKLLTVDEAGARANVAYYRWAVDSVGKQERVDCFPQGSCPDDASTFIVKYYETYAVKWTVNSAGECSRARTKGLTATTQKWSISPLRYFRTGTIPNLATAKPYLTTTSAYRGRTNQRGVPADTFSGRIYSENLGKKYDFNQYLYFYPDYWTFPGRESNKQIPVRVFNTGTYTEGTSSIKVPFNDTWDIYLFINDITNPQIFNLKQWGCDESDKWLDEDMPDETGSKAWIVAIILLVLGVVGCVVWSIHKQRTHKQQDWKQDQSTTTNNEPSHRPQQLVEEE